MSLPQSEPETIVRLIGVYDADATLLGELAYWVGARLGRRHCSLCDITHSAVRTKAEWKQCRSEFSVPFETYHRNDQPPTVRNATGGAAPIVVAETNARIVQLLNDEQLRSCAGSVDGLRAAVETAVTELGLRWETGWA